MSYGPVVGSAPRRARRERLRASHGFDCACEGCLRDERGRDEGRVADASLAAGDSFAARWGVVLDEARASFAAREHLDEHLRRLDAAVGEIRARARKSSRGDPSHHSHKLLAEALDARALGFVTVARVSLDTQPDHAVACVSRAASSAREALDILAGALGYQEASLTLALERARVAALDAAGGRFEASRADSRRARETLRVALGESRDASRDTDVSRDTDDGSRNAFEPLLPVSRVVDGGFERRALFVVDAMAVACEDAVDRFEHSTNTKGGFGGLFELD